MRTFFSIPVKAKDISIYRNFINNKNKSCVNLINWVLDENLHITLHFLGNIDKEIIDELLNIIKKSDYIKKINPFDLEISSIGYLNMSHSKALVLFISKNKELNNLYNILGDIIISQGLKIESRDYLPHITLARVKNNINIKNINIENIYNTIIYVNNFDLLESKLNCKNYLYKKIAGFNI